MEADPASPSRAERTRASRRDPGVGLLAVLWLVGTGLLALLAYSALFRVQPRAEELSEELEIWLLMPSQTSAAIVAALSGWLLYRRRQQLAALDPRAGPAWLTALLLGLAAAVFAWGTYTGASDLLAFSLMACVLGVGNLFWGKPALRALGLPVGFLLFAVPMPAALLNVIVFRFQVWTAELTGLLLYLIGLPAFVAGEQILREGDSFTIVEGCSGMRSVETLTMLSVLMVDLFRRRGWHAVLLVAVAPPLAFLLNGWRAVFLMLNPLAGTTLIHNAQGIAILLVGVLLIFGLDGLLARLLPDTGPGPARRAGPRARLGWRRPLAATASFAALAALAHWMPVWQPPAAGIPRLEGRIPEKLDGWRGRELKTDYYVFLGRTGFGQTLERRYRRGTESVDLFVGETDHRDRLRNALSPKTMLPGSGWIVEEAGTTSLPAPIGREVDYRVLRSGTRRLLVYHWRTGMEGLAGETLRSLAALDQSFLRRSRHARVIRVTTELGAPSIRNRQAAEKRLAEFSEAIWGSLSPVETSETSALPASGAGSAAAVP